MLFVLLNCVCCAAGAFAISTLNETGVATIHLWQFWVVILSFVGIQFNTVAMFLKK